MILDYQILLLPGDGIGREITYEAKKILETLGKKRGISFSFTEAVIGGEAIDKFQEPCPEETLAACREASAVLLGAVGGPAWDHMPVGKRPESGLLKLRQKLGLYANLRPVFLYPALAYASPLKKLEGGRLDMMIVRELTGGIYFGKRFRDEDSAYDTESYSKFEIERIAKRAFKIASARGGKLTLVDKANVLATSSLWREVVGKMSAGYPDVKVDYMYVDNAAMQLIIAPERFDVILTSNMFGDILSDEASALIGSIGMMPSASLSDFCGGLYEPAHGSAPELAGLDIANPLASILSAAMLLRFSLGLQEEAVLIEKAVSSVLERGIRTKDLYRKEEGETLVGTCAMGDAVCDAL